MFNQPGGASNFFDTVVAKKVSLENAYMESPTLIAGIVRVLNIDYHKSVTVRWTMNDWSTFHDLPAVYVPGSSDGFSDKFSFRLCLGSLPVGSRIQFCLRYNSSGAEFWDSNNGTNYVFQVPQAASICFCVSLWDPDKFWSGSNFFVRPDHDPKQFS
jgi:protein phosphatase 1 regulatory subunit 3A/B/C/D/E